MKFPLETDAEKGKFMFALSAGLNLASWTVIALNISSITFPAIIHYNVFFGRDLLGEKAMLFSAPILGVAIWLVNFWIWRILYGTGRRFVGLVVASTNIFIQTLVLLIARIAILVNT